MYKTTVKYIFLFVSIFCFCIAGYGQKAPAKKHSPQKTTPKKQELEADDTVKVEEPKDTVTVTFGKNIVNLRTLTGFIKDEKGKWLSSPNRIPYQNHEFNNELYVKYKIGYENIRQINIVEIKIDSTPYLAFIIEQDKGFYRDSAHEDFKYYVAADYFLIKATDFRKMWNDSLKMNKPYEATMKAYYSGLVGYKDVKLRPKFMTMELNKDIRNSVYTDTSVKTYLQFGMKPVQNKKGKFMRFYYGLAYARTGAAVEHFDFDVMDRRYYETDLDLFHRFARPKSLDITPPGQNKTRPQEKPTKKPKEQKKTEDDQLID